MIKYSRQRECIVNFLASRTDHPTAETIYLNTKKDFPNISLGTVYRNLSLLEEIVMDLDLDFNDNLVHRAQDATEHTIESCSVSFTGLCADCASNTTN